MEWNRNRRIITPSIKRVFATDCSMNGEFHLWRVDLHRYSIKPWLNIPSYSKAGIFVAIRLVSISMTRPIEECWRCFNHINHVNNASFWTCQYAKGFFKKRCGSEAYDQWIWWMGWSTWSPFMKLLLTVEL